MAKTCVCGILFLMNVGCWSASNFDARGYVCAQIGRSDSIVMHGVEPDERYVRLGEAHVTLSYDANKTAIINDTTSGDDGSYRLTMPAEELSKVQGRKVYLIVEKEGYESLSQAITVGPFSPYSRNV